MNLFSDKEKIGFSRKVIPVLVTAVLFILLNVPYGYSAPPNKLETFASPEEAFSTLVEAIRTGNQSQLVALIGPHGKTIFSSEARISDQTKDRFLQEYGEQKRLEKVGDNLVVLHVGREDWSWPIPLVRVGQKWRFDVERGRKEILARRIGGNEVAAVQVCLAFVDAQREYAREHLTTRGMSEYAQKFLSDQGKENGLCWTSNQEEKQGPLGPLLAKACPTDHSGLSQGEKPAPYYGYYYKILTRQGPRAQGGAYNYIVEGKMIGGFALVAYPAFFGHSGIMTFIVNQNGQVYEKNLGKKTGEIARAMDEFNPDKTWKKVD